MDILTATDDHEVLLSVTPSKQTDRLRVASYNNTSGKLSLGLAAWARTKNCDIHRSGGTGDTRRRVKLISYRNNSQYSPGNWTEIIIFC